MLCIEKLLVAYKSYHKSYHDLGDKTYPGGKEIKNGDEVRLALLNFS